MLGHWALRAAVGPTCPGRPRTGRRGAAQAMANRRAPAHLPLRQCAAQAVLLRILREHRLLHHHRLGPEVRPKQAALHLREGESARAGGRSGGEVCEGDDRKAWRQPVGDSRATCTVRSLSCQHSCAAVRTSVSKAPHSVSTAVGGWRRGPSTGGALSLPAPCPFPARQGLPRPCQAWRSHLLGHSWWLRRPRRRCPRGWGPALHNQELQLKRAVGHNPQHVWHGLTISMSVLLRDHAE